MSRIDEALKRARLGAKSNAHAPIETSGVGAVVVPSWQFERLPTERPAEPLVAPAGVRARAAETRETTPPRETPASLHEVHVARPSAPRYSASEVSPAYADRIVGGAASAPAASQYRRLAAALHEAQRTKSVKIVMVASAVPGEGKTLTAVNLALTLSQSYKRQVLLVDADLRRPTIHEMFQVSNVVGLGDALAAGVEQRVGLIEYSSRLSVLPAGRPQADPMHLLVSDRLRRLLQEAGETFDWVVVDTPPITLVPDAHLLAHMVDAAVLVVRSGSTPHHLAAKAADALGRDRVAGVVLNAVAAADVAQKTGDGYGYGYGYGDAG